MQQEHTVAGEDGSDGAAKIVSLPVIVSVASNATTSRAESRAAPTSQFLRLVQQQATQRSEEQFCVWIDEHMAETDSRTFGELWLRAGAVAGMMSREGVVPGDRVLLCFNFGLQFLDAFLGCLRLGAIAVPVYPPNPAKLQEALKKLDLVARDCSAKLCIMDQLVDRLRAATRGWPSSMAYKVPKIDPKKDLTGVNEQNLDLRADVDVAFLQYTSGSTGDPKGVMLTFGNIHHNLLLTNRIVPQTADASAAGCSWLPQFHDMGLLFCTLYPLARGRRQVFMSPSAFIARPVLWLEAMARYKCTWTTAPNFAYGLSARKFSETPKARRPLLDLSNVLALGNAAEPVRLKTMVDFVETFRHCGLDARASFFPSYGLAEHTVTATTIAHSIAADPSLAGMTDQSGKFVMSGLVSGPAEDAPGERPLVDVRIVVDGEEVEEGKVGEIWLRSGSRGQGYWGMPERSAETFGGELKRPRAPLQELEGETKGEERRFLRTGDEGFLEAAAGGGWRLFVCGRAKDVIIIRGKNSYPQDLELTAERSSGGLLRQNCSAAFQSQLPDSGGDLEAADLVCEVKRAGFSEGELSKACDAIAAGVRAEHSVRLRRVVLIRPKTIPKTTSGKIRRKETRRALEAGELMRHALVVWEDVEVEVRAQRRREEAGTGGGEGEGEGEEMEEVKEKSVVSFARVIVAEVALATGMETEEVVAHQGSLAATGLESITAHSLCFRLSARLGVQVDASEVIPAASINQLASYLFHKLNASELSEDEATESGTPGHAPGSTRLVASVLGSDEPVDRNGSVKTSFRAMRAAWRSLGSVSGTFKSGREDSTRSTLRPGPREARLSITSMTSASSLASSSASSLPLDFSFGERAARIPHFVPEAGALSLLLRVAVQLALIFWVLLSVYVCAVPAVALMERVTDLQIFPLFLFRWLVEPRVDGPARFHGWGDHNNGFSLALFPRPEEPWISSVYLAVPLGLIGATGSFLAAFSLYVVLLKWLVLGRVQPGDYALWGVFYWRRWLVQRHVEILSLLLALLFQDAAPLSVLYTLLGARIGSRASAVLQVGAELDLDLVSVGGAAAVDGSACLLTGVVVGATLRLRRVEVGAGSDVRANSVLTPGVVLPPRSVVAKLSVVTPSIAASAQAGATFKGAPACVASDEPLFRGSEGTTAFEMLLRPAAWLLCLGLQAWLSLMPLVAVHATLLAEVKLSGLSLVAVAVMDLSLYLLGLSLCTLAAKWLLLGRRLKPGARVAKRSATELGRECVHRLHGLVHRFVLCHLWGGESINVWYRLLGARVAPGAVFSTGVAVSDFDAVDVGACVLLGGGCTLETSVTCPETGDRLIRGVTLAEGATCGTNSIVGAGSTLGERALVGVLSQVPAGSEVAAHTAVMGSKWKYKAKRCYVPKAGVPRRPPVVRELYVWGMYLAWTVLAVWAALYGVWWLRTQLQFPAMVLFPLGAGVYQLLQLLLVVLNKQLLVRLPRCGGSGEEREVELHSFGHWFRLYSHMFFQHCYDLSLLGHLMRGGPLMPLFLRALRADAHLDSYISATWIYDYEQLEIGHGAAVNALACISPHVIASCASARLLRVTIAPGATLWPRAIALGETSVPSGTQLGPLSRMVASSTALALEEAEREATRQGPRAPEQVLLGMPARHFVESGLGGEADDSGGDISNSLHASFVNDHALPLPV